MCEIIERNKKEAATVAAAAATTKTIVNSINLNYSYRQLLSANR